MEIGRDGGDTLHEGMVYFILFYIGLILQMRTVDFLIDSIHRSGFPSDEQKWVHCCI
jgi:hypothetical protein